MRRFLVATIALVVAAACTATPVMADQSIDALFDEELRPALPASAASSQLASPYAFEFTGEDALRLTVTNSKSGVVVGVHYRMHTPENHAFASREFLTPTSDRVATTGEFTIGRGYLQNVTIFATSGAPARGQTFVRLQVIRGRGAGAVVLGTIVQGYITSNQDRAWPGSPLEGSLDGDGYYRLIQGTDPVAGSEISETVPTGARWELITIHGVLVTSAAVGNRSAMLAVGRPESVALVLLPHGVAQPASKGVNHYWAAVSAVLSLVTNDGLAPLPSGLTLLAGQTFATNTSGMDAGDNWTAPVYSVREWLEAQ